MNSIDLYNAMGGIDEKLIARAEQKERINKMKYKNIILKRVIPVAACFAIAAGVIFGFNGNIAKNEKSNINSAISCNPRFGLIIASAQNGEFVSYNKIDMEKSYNIELPVKCRFKIECVKGLSDKEKNKVFHRLSAEDYNASMIELEVTAKEKALSKGVLEKADTNAEAIIRNFIGCFEEASKYKIEVRFV